MSDTKGDKTLTGEQELIINTKRELELLSKDFLRCNFRIGNEGNIGWDIE